jgi:hypothetical protein
MSLELEMPIVSKNKNIAFDSNIEIKYLRGEILRLERFYYNE